MAGDVRRDAKGGGAMSDGERVLILLVLLLLWMVWPSGEGE